MQLAGNAVAALGAHSQCPKCETNVPRVPHPKEIAELAEEVRLRMLKAEKTSYWRQFEQGMLGRQAVLALINLADTAMDTPDRYASSVVNIDNVVVFPCLKICLVIFAYPG